MASALCSDALHSAQGEDLRSPRLAAETPAVPPIYEVVTAGFSEGECFRTQATLRLGGLLSLSPQCATYISLFIIHERAASRGRLAPV